MQPQSPCFSLSLSSRPLFKRVPNAFHGDLCWMSLNEQVRASWNTLFRSDENDISGVTRRVRQQVTTALSLTLSLMQKENEG